MRRIFYFIIMFSIILGVLTDTEGLLNTYAASNNSDELPAWVDILNVTDDVMLPGTYTALGGSTFANTHGKINFAPLSVSNVSELVGTGFNFTCCTCSDWRYSIRFNNTGNTTTTGQNNGTGRGKYIIVDIDITGVTTGEELVELIIDVAGNNPGGHDNMVFRQESTTSVLVISSTTSNKPPSVVSGYLMSGVWNPDAALGPYRYGDWAYDIINDIGIVITGYDGKNKYVTIPNGIIIFIDSESGNEYKILPVVAIGDYAFTKTKLTSVTIPNTVKTIGRGAFYYCTNLSKVTIPDSVESIEAIAFFNCVKLTNVTFPSNLESIGKDAFSGCKALQDLYFLSASPPDIKAPFFWGIGGTTGTARAIVPNGSKLLYTGGVGNYWSDLLVTEDNNIGIRFVDDSDVILEGVRTSENVTTPINYQNGVYEINLTKETITFAWGFEAKAYSLDGGVKWKNVKDGMFHETKFPKLLDRGMTLVVSDKAIAKGKKKPGEEAVTIAFPPIAKRQSQSPPKSHKDQMNLKKFYVQPIITNKTPSTDPTWFLSLTKIDLTPIHVNKREFEVYQKKFDKEIDRIVEIGVAFKNTVNSRGYGQIPSDTTEQMLRMPRQSLQGQPPRNKSVKTWEYVIRFAPGIIEVNGEIMAVAASKPRKIKVKSIP